MTKPYCRGPESPTILARGAWVRRGSIQVWEPTPTTPTTTQPDAVVHDIHPQPIIACAVCFARITERCRTAAGKITHPHKGRLTLACPCGEPRDLPNWPECATCRTRVDDSIVERLLAGERVDSRPAEKTEALRRWLETGRSERAFCRIHGWKHGRYTPAKRTAVAA